MRNVCLLLFILIFYQEAIAQQSSLTDSLENTVKQLQDQLEQERRTHQAELKKVATQKNQTQTRQQQLERYILVIVAFASEVIVFILLINLRRKKKHNAQLALQNEEVIEKNKQLSDLNHEKEILLQEIHHRVKNNLQIISTLLDMQSHYQHDPRLVQVILEGQNRVKAMAMLHQSLYRNEQLNEIDFREYAGQLLDHLAIAFGRQHKTIRSTVNDSAIKLDMDTAISLGLILNELISNTYKYAFRDSDEVAMGISLTSDEDHYHLHVADSGQGLPNDFDESKLNSLGLKLVRMLTEQLDGTLVISNSPGACFSIRFKKPKASE